MSYFDPLRAELKQYLSRKKINQIHKAYLIAEEAHKPQKRKSGEPYITHPVAVAIILAKMRMDAATIIAAILHDTVEDTSVTHQQIVDAFDNEVADLVDGVTKLTQMKFESVKHAQAENFRKMFLAMSEDIRVILIKLADRLHNMQTLTVFRSDKCHRIAKETLEIFAPIAHRLGMHSFRVEFERLGFEALHPLRYRVIKKCVEQSRGERREIVEMIETTLKDCLKRAKIKYNSIAGREKALYSVYKKMKQKRAPLSEVLDIYAFRIVVPNIDACYRTLGQVHSLYKPLPRRFKDYISIPKANGYQSLHTTLLGPYGVPIEIQIRTTDMDHVAESGIAAHWIYKSGDKIANDAQHRAREWVKQILELQHNSGDTVEFLENVKIDLFPDELYVFTPRGNIVKLQSGSTPVDFAYNIHTDVGNTCIAAKVDRQYVPLTTTLENGQTVEIMNSPTATPNAAWLNFVVTGKARSGIRHFLKSRRREESADLGRRLFNSALEEAGVDASSEDLQQVTLVLGMKTVEDLYESIGLGNRVASVLVSQVKAMKEDTEEFVSNVGHGFKDISIKGTEGMALQFADCCYPIPGDNISGVLQGGQGIMVHRTECEKLKRLHQHVDKLITLGWAEHVHGQFHTFLNIQVPNEPGVLAALALAIADAGSNIENIGAESSDNQFISVDIELTVTNRHHLANVMRRIHSINKNEPIHSKRILKS